MRLSNRCFARAIVGETQDAVTDCKDRCGCGPESAVVHGRRGLACLKLGKLDEAMDDFGTLRSISARARRCRSTAAA